MFKTTFSQPHPLLHGLLGLTPLLAVSTRLIDAVIFATVLAVLFVLTSTVVALLRDWIAAPLRLPAVLLISGGCVSVVDVLSHAWLYEWHQTVDVYLPLLVVSCLLLAWLETEAMTRPWRQLMTGALEQGLAMLMIFVLLALLRESLGQGSLLAGIDSLPGLTATAPLLRWPAPLPLLAEPAGGLLLLGFVFAAWTWLTTNASHKAQSA